MSPYCKSNRRPDPAAAHPAVQLFAGSNAAASSSASSAGSSSSSSSPAATDLAPVHVTRSPCPTCDGVFYCSEACHESHFHAHQYDCRRKRYRARYWPVLKRRLHGDAANDAAAAARAAPASSSSSSSSSTASTTPFRAALDEFTICSTVDYPAALKAAFVACYMTCYVEADLLFEYAYRLGYHRVCGWERGVQPEWDEEALAAVADVTQEEEDAEFAAFLERLVGVLPGLDLDLAYPEEFDVRRRDSLGVRWWVKTRLLLGDSMGAAHVINHELFDPAGELSFHSECCQLLATLCTGSNVPATALQYLVGGSKEKYAPRLRYLMVRGHGAHPVTSRRFLDSVDERILASREEILVTLLEPHLAMRMAGGMTWLMVAPGKSDEVVITLTDDHVLGTVRLYGSCGAGHEWFVLVKRSLRSSDKPVAGFVSREDKEVLRSVEPVWRKLLFGCLDAIEEEVAGNSTPSVERMLALRHAFEYTLRFASVSCSPENVIRWIDTMSLECRRAPGSGAALLRVQQLLHMAWYRTHWVEPRHLVMSPQPNFAERRLAHMLRLCDTALLDNDSHGLGDTALRFLRARLVAAEGTDCDFVREFLLSTISDIEVLMAKTFVREGRYVRAARVLHLDPLVPPKKGEPEKTAASYSYFAQRSPRTFEEYALCAEIFIELDRTRSEAPFVLVHLWHKLCDELGLKELDSVQEHFEPHVEQMMLDAERLPAEPPAPITQEERFSLWRMSEFLRVHSMWTEDRHRPQNLPAELSTRPALCAFRMAAFAFGPNSMDAAIAFERWADTLVAASITPRSKHWAEFRSKLEHYLTLCEEPFRVDKGTFMRLLVHYMYVMVLENEHEQAREIAEKALILADECDVEPHLALDLLADVQMLHGEHDQALESRTDAYEVCLSALGPYCHHTVRLKRALDELEQRKQGGTVGGAEAAAGPSEEAATSSRSSSTNGKTKKKKGKKSKKKKGKKGRKGR